MPPTGNRTMSWSGCSRPAPAELIWGRPAPSHGMCSLTLKVTSSAYWDVGYQRCSRSITRRPLIDYSHARPAANNVQMTRGCDLRCPAMYRRPGGGSTEMPHSTGEFGVVNRSAPIHVKYLGQR